MNKDLLTEREVAAMGVASVRTLQGWRLFNRGPRYLKPGGRSVRYRLADIEAFLAAGAVNPGGESPKMAQSVRPGAGR